MGRVSAREMLHRRPELRAEYAAGRAAYDESVQAAIDGIDTLRRGGPKCITPSALAAACGRSRWWAIGALDASEAEGHLIRSVNGGYRRRTQRVTVWASLRPEEHRRWLDLGAQEWLRRTLAKGHER